MLFCMAVCYIPPAGSSRDVDTEEHFLMLSEQNFGLEGRVCGDLNARCGGLDDLNEEMILLRGTRKRLSVDSVRRLICAQVQLMIKEIWELNY